MQGAVERTQTITVMERKVAVGENGKKTELGVPHDVFVRPMPMRRWLQAMTYLNAILKALPNTGIDLENPMQMALWVMTLFAEIPDQITGLLELATDEPADLFDRIDLDEGVNVVMAVVNVNKDFFVQKVLPLLSGIAPALKEKVESTFGQTQ